MYLGKQNIADTTFKQ